ncbi:hypothetical protein EJB05_39895 [Eragrostis curvula]|uniref:DUF1618 domain-containing protein n=1 Tax=Eragrostis curvula TaxID=38414 RepID=A0A5J9TYS7_9POAL|nr:hypothetical protein EJB05_39895 [Eragrostis curvula]
MATSDNFNDDSLHPPALDHQSPDEAGCPLSWAMLDARAYIADRRNTTTAYGRTSTGVEIQVTFCTASPPVVSYFCVWCPEEPDLAKLYAEPRIIAAEADIVVLGVGLCFPNRSYGPQNQDIFVYQAGGWAKAPSLHLVRYPGIHLYFNVGILHHPNHNNQNEDPVYIVGFDPSERPWEFTVNLYNSKAESWSSFMVSLGRQHQHSQFRHSASKVIMMGEDDLMGFVDLRRGILFCDVLACTRLYYIPFPKPLKLKQQQGPDPIVSRNIAVVQDDIKVVDCSRCSISGLWKVSVWSRKAASLEEHWNMDHTLEICDNLVDSTTTLHFELLPMLDVDGIPRRTLEGLHISYPTLSLDNDDIVYFMAKVEPWDKDAWVLAVDMGTKKLKDVGVFRAERCSGATISYIHSRITKYFSSSSGMKGDLKRLGPLLPGSPCKKHSGVV